MKKTIIILLASLYLVILSGLTINLHYCAGKLKSIAFLKNAEKDICCCNKTKKKITCKTKLCCKEKTIIVKVNDNHNNTSDLKAPNCFWSKLFRKSLPVSTTIFSIAKNSEITPFCTSPPDLYRSPIYLQHRVLLI
jgi:hypothetical protein